MAALRAGAPASDFYRFQTVFRATTARRNVISGVRETATCARRMHFKAVISFASKPKNSSECSSRRRRGLLCLAEHSNANLNANTRVQCEKKNIRKGATRACVYACRCRTAAAKGELHLQCGVATRPHRWCYRCHVTRRFHHGVSELLREEKLGAKRDFSNATLVKKTQFSRLPCIAPRRRVVSRLHANAGYNNIA